MSRVSKLHETIVTSSIWNESDTTRIVWVTMLAIRDRKGFVGASVGGLAHVARVSAEACQAAIAKFLGPDPDSRTKDDEGRRIREVDGGWIILNHEKHSLADDDDAAFLRKAKFARERAKKYRDAKKAAKTRVSGPTVTQRHAKRVTKRDETSETPTLEAEPAQPPLFKFDPPAETSKPTKAEAARLKRLPTTEIPKRIATLFGRRLTTAWSDEEVSKYKSLGQIDPADLDLIEGYYRAERAKGDGDNGGRHRRDLKTFLNNFHGELDRARLAVPKSATPKHEDPTGWREWLKETGNDKGAYRVHRFAPEFLKSDFAKSRKGK